MAHKQLTAMLTALCLAGSAGLVHAQSASTTGTGGASESSGTVGSGGSAAAGDTSASSVGTGGTSTGEDGTSSSIGSAGSAAGGDKNTSSTKIHENPNMLHGKSQAKAKDQGGTWSKSKPQTKVKQ